MSISIKVKSTLERIEAKSKEIGVDPKNIVVIGASKYASAEKIREANSAGINVFGENKVQDLLKKEQVLKDLSLKWHFIGHLQTNKVKKIIGQVELIHSVDSIRLAEEINKRAYSQEKKQFVLLQTNISSESSKSGFKPSESLQKAKDIAKLDGIKVKGLMTIAPFTNKEEILRNHFNKSEKLFDAIKENTGDEFELLSMGMSNDFEIAMEYGANILRLGSVLFK